MLNQKTCYRAAATANKVSKEETDPEESEVDINDELDRDSDFEVKFKEEPDSDFEIDPNYSDSN
jgi:hypothetical protein